jgi:hypothetical protein
MRVFRDANAVVGEGLRLFIFTQSLTAGVSLEKFKASALVGYYETNTDPVTFTQMCGRVRQQPDVIELYTGAAGHLQPANSEQQRKDAADLQRSSDEVLELIECTSDRVEKMRRVAFKGVLALFR